MRESHSPLEILSPVNLANMQVNDGGAQHPGQSMEEGPQKTGVQVQIPPRKRPRTQLQAADTREQWGSKTSELKLDLDQVN